MNKIFCLIPARAGSERIPNKNRKNFNDRPAIWHSLDIAGFLLDGEYITNFCVSTDDEKIKSYSIKFGFLIHHRIKTADKKSTLADVCREVIKDINPDCDWILLLYSTAFYTKKRIIVDFLNNLASYSNYDVIYPFKDKQLGQFYLIKKDFFKQNIEILEAKKQLAVKWTSKTDPIDIDTIDDWKKAEDELKGKVLVGKIKKTS